MTVGGDALRGVGWLTLVGEELVTQMGDVRKLRSELSAEIEVIETRHGSIIRALFALSPAVGARSTPAKAGASTPF